MPKEKSEALFGKGGHPDKIDIRDKKYLGMGSSPFDWDKGFDIEENLSVLLTKPGFKLPVKDQNGSFSCGGQAWASYASVLEAIATGTFEERSAKYLYAQTHAPAGGSYGRDNCKVCVKQGVARETSTTSYENGKPPSEKFMIRSQDIGIEARNDAKTAKHLTYAQVTPAWSIETCAQSIRDNHGVIIGISGTNNGTWLSEFPKPPAANQMEWRHWVYAGKAKKIDGIKCIGILNSWGKDCGKEGWQWIPEIYFATMLITDENSLIKTISLNPSYGEHAIWNVWTMIFDESPTPPTFEEKKTDSWLSLASLWKLLAELIERSRVAQWVSARFGNERAKTAGNARSSQWSLIRAAHLHRNPTCAVCGGKEKIEVHHIKPFHTNPELELDFKNLITLCEAGKNGIVCHQAIGHLGNYRSINIDVNADALLWRTKLQNRPK